MIIHVFWQFVFTIMIIHAAIFDDMTTNEAVETIFLRVYNGTTIEEYDDYPLENASAITSRITDNKPTVLYIHGLNENLEENSVQTVVKAYLKRNDHNIIGVDYRNLAKDLYPIAVEHVSRVGDAVTTALNKMVESGFDTKKLHIVGHSLGAQVSSYIGKKVNFQIPRITGLDPAGPLFNIVHDSLSSSDAAFVDIIHTDFGFYGVAKTTGTIDFFPNGGSRIQPGCPSVFLPSTADDFCSHYRSWEYYAESVPNESAFLGVECSSSLNFQLGECSNNSRIIMGYATPRSAQGTVYLVTDKQSPFGLKEAGLLPN
ncbi:pancreatic triacylglycerol lipase-like [Monomorium pharaonis]|uniref:pancreatic triacylglycerol lipase-like n=1 Tax=Monomorium pharaonis TaxID=307658 RepID=UPI0017476426|nr:pancreatic triacylglycerol lipase-like [Monomorium pharaonis]